MSTPTSAERPDLPYVVPVRLDRARADLLHALPMLFGRSLSFEATVFGLALAFDAALVRIAAESPALAGAFCFRAAVARSVVLAATRAALGLREDRLERGGDRQGAPAPSQCRREADRRGAEYGLDAPAHLLGVKSGLDADAPDRVLAVEALRLASADAPRDGGDSLLWCQRRSMHGVVFLSGLA